MDEARQVLDRLDRIEALGRRAAQPETLIVELRELVREAEVWARREGGAASGAATAIETLRAAVRGRGPPDAAPDTVSSLGRRRRDEGPAPSED